jgi:NifB/MoaA-like Fe-S oxidoreductase
VESWQLTFLSALGRPVVFASDEYYLISGRPLPPLEAYGEAAQLENGVGVARTFEARFLGLSVPGATVTGGFFQSVDGAPAAGYRAERSPGGSALGIPATVPSRGAPVTVLTGEYGAAVLAPVLAEAGPQVEVVGVVNEYFGGNIKVAGLLTGQDLARVLQRAPRDRRYLLPDVCLSGGRFLDGLGPLDLPRPVEVVPTDGASLRGALRSSSSG